MNVTRNQWGNIALVVPVVLVNVFAVVGQAGWALDHLFGDGRLAVAAAVMFAVTVESVGVFLAAEAHRSLMAGDAALRLRLASYLVAGLAGALNYHHFAPTLAPNTSAVTFGAMSAISPWMWAIRSRSLRRAELRAAGLIDPRTVRFSTARWLLWFRPTWEAYRRAVWLGEQDPLKAINLTAPEDATVTVEPLPAPAVEAPKPALAVKPDPDRSRVLAAIVRDINKGAKPSIRSVKAAHKVGTDTARELIAEATERAEASRVVPIGGHQ